MSETLQDLIARYLDDNLSSDELAHLNALLKEHPAHVRELARAMLLHDRLHAEVHALAPAEVTVSRSPLIVRSAKSPRRWAVPALAAVAAFSLIWFYLWPGEPGSSASAAAGALDRMIDAAGKQVDRVYNIRVTEHGPDGPQPPVSSGIGGRRPGIEGATLYVRGTDQFVLVRRFGNGAEFITGSDGEIGWSAPPRGHVHLSEDKRRFRRGVPGEHDNLPFIDLKAGFANLQRGYELELRDIAPNAEMPTATHELVATKRPNDRPGPQGVRIAFDSAGVARRIELSGLKNPESSARGVALELTEQRDLGPDFFKHQSHHGPNRSVNWE